MIENDGTKRPRAIRIDDIIKEHVQEFIKNGKLIDKNGLAIGHGGNLSVKVPGGILITSTGSLLSDLKPDEIVFVGAADSDFIYFTGPKNPSSETITHWVIYQKNPNARAIAHVNTGPKDSKNIVVSEREITYGTKELGEDTARLLQKTNVVMMKNHGLMAIGNSLAEATQLAIDSGDRKKPYIFT
jgi:L-fuculose-phosphate aldolase